MSRVTDTVSHLVEPILEDMDLELVNIEYVKEGKNWFLRVYIDSETGVSLNTCTAVSERLSAALDEEDPIKDPYYLEVSSAGAERPLKSDKDFQKAVGKNVRITTYEAIEGEKTFEGVLKEAGDETVVVVVDQRQETKDYVIPADKIASARLAIVF